MSESFGEEIKRRREALDPSVSQSQLAGFAGVSRGTISNLERGLLEAVTRQTKRGVISALEALEDGRRPERPEQLRESIALQIEAQLAPYPEDVFPEGSDSPEGRYIAAMRHAYRTAARIARGEDQ